jgi:enamine deaminase RidA (YjgF/YER057c/UK114 family)
MHIDEHPYSPAFIVGDHCYVSGSLSVDSEGAPVRGRRSALDAAIARMVERLSTVGMDISNVVKLTYFVTDISLRSEANAQLAHLFVSRRPARSFVEVSALPYGASVEIDAIAVRPGAER